MTERLERLADNLYRLEGSIPGMPMGRVMVVARMSDGGAIVHNGIAGGEDLYREIEAVGPVRYLVVPNGWHRLDAAAYRARFPGAKVVAPAGSKKRVEQKVPVDLTYEEVPRDADVQLETLDGLKAAEGVMRVRSSDGVTLVFTDAVFNLEKRIPGFYGFVFHDVVGSKPGPRVTRIGRWFLVKEKVAYRAHLERLAATPELKRVIVAHGGMVQNDPAGMLRVVASTL